ncbi:MAG: DUF3859 domain-containing protein [Bacteroidales bacterium]|nr:DUF3859 domain-containing protein [Bacteroidales bacterium]
MKKSKKKFEVSVESYGRYTPWDNGSKILPKIIEFTSEIEAIEGNEFGMVLNIKRGKGINLHFVISHPLIRNSAGELLPEFTGDYKVTSNDFHFFIGDGIQAPVEEKSGLWKISVFYKNHCIAEKEFHVILKG